MAKIAVNDQGFEPTRVTLKAGEDTFTCGMDMLKGTVVVQ
jgi:hypothetical protein